MRCDVLPAGRRSSADLSALMAVTMSRFCRLLLFEKSLECSTIFSSSSMSSEGRFALMNAFTVQLT